MKGWEPPGVRIRLIVLLRAYQQQGTGRRRDPALGELMQGLVWGLGEKRSALPAWLPWVVRAPCAAGWFCTPRELHCASL